MPAIIALALGVAAPLPSEPNGHTTVEIRAMKPGQLNRTLRHDLLSILQPLNDLPQGNRIGLGDVTLTTKGFATRLPGVCARDQLTVRYSPTEKTRDYANVEVQPYALESEREYYFLTPPTKDTSDQEGDWLPWDRGCEKAAQIEYDGWFDASSEYSAVDTYLVFLAAVEAVRRDPSKMTECDLIVSETSKCTAQFVEYGKSTDFSSFGRCDGDEKEDCYSIEVEGAEIRVRSTKGSKASDPKNIIGVSIAVMIIVT